MTTEPPAEPLGRRIGPYLVERVVGRGGTGIVYLARRVDAGFDQHVAIKVLSHTVETGTVDERLAREREALARLNHPNIARLIDAGTSDDGHAYLVMEYVEGVPVTNYVRDHHCSERVRLDLFRAICSAVEHAHQHRVVHRDVKPSNLLVGESGIPKLLDFGTATVFGTEPLATTGLGALTIAYASPERLRGLPGSASTDVFSLGTLLFELLTERPMWTDSIAARINGNTKWARNGVVPEVARILDKATAMDPAARYASVGQLSEDVRRYIDHEPVLAVGLTARYRLRQFARRHRSGVTASAVLACGLVAALGVVAYQARAAREARARADEQLHELTRSLLTDTVDELAKEPGGMKAQEALVERALQQFDGLVAESSHAPALLAEAGEAYVRMGNLLGNPYTNNKGQESRALETYLKGLSVLAGAGDSPAVNAARGRLHRNSGQVLYARGKTETAVAEMRQGLAAYEQAARADGTGKYDLDVISTRNSIGDVLFDADPRQALALFDASASELDRVRQSHPGYEVNGIIEYKRGACHEMLGNMPAAIEHYRQGVRDNDRLPEASRGAPNNRRARASLLSVLGSALASVGQGDEAMTALDESVAIARALAEADTGSTRAMFSLAANLSNRSSAARSLDRPQVWHESLLAEAEAWAVLLSKTQVPLYQSGAAANMSSLSQSFAARGDAAAARARMRRSLALFEAVLKGTPTPEDRRRYAEALLEGGAPDLRDPARALEQTARALHDSGSSSAPLLQTHALALLRAGHAADAIVPFEKVLTMMPSELPASERANRRRIEAWLTEARVAAARTR